MNHNERNHSTLKEAIQQLPHYSPPSFVWEEVEQALEQEPREVLLQQAIGQLPDYAPPPQVWENIADSLSESGSRHTRVVPLWARAVAAGAALLIGAFLFWPGNSQEPQIEYAYEQATQNTGLFENDWDEDEALMKTVSRQFLEAPLPRRHPEFNNMAEEWEELGDARAEIKDMIELYGKDAQLIHQLVEVEQERSNMIKKMAAEL